MGLTEDSDCALKKSPWYLIEFVSIHHQGYKSKNLLTFWSYFGCVQLQWELHELKDTKGLLLQIIGNFYMAESASGQDEANPV